MTKPIPIGLSNTPFYIRQNQDWAITQERYRHDQSMYIVGEPAMFALMWKVEDYQEGLVQRCSICYQGDNARAAQVFNQPTKNRCPDCLGTTFEGGLRAKIIRPAIFTDTDDQETVSEHGAVHPQNLMVESTSDFRFRNGDYVIRWDNSRWQLGAPQRVTIRTGYTHPSQAATSFAYAPAPASLEDLASVAYMITPSDAASIEALLAAPTRYPVYPNPNDVINGPLIPPAITD